MPIHDWTRVDAGLFHDFHQSWTVALRNALNSGVLPADYFALTRILLVPSVWDEPFGRVAAEAMINAVPPLVANRGSLPHVVGAVGYRNKTRDRLGSAAKGPG